jgi:hypothetical protein
MPGHACDMITTAERRFPVRVRIGVPPGGLGQRYGQITAWLDGNCSADGWSMTRPASAACSMMLFRSTSQMQRSRVPSSRAGAAGPRSRQPAACSRCGKMSRRRGSGRGCIGHREGKLDQAGTQLRSKAGVLG